MNHPRPGPSGSSHPYALRVAPFVSVSSCSSLLRSVRTARSAGPRSLYTSEDVFWVWVFMSISHLYPQRDVRRRGGSFVGEKNQVNMMWVLWGD